MVGMVSELKEEIEKKIGKGKAIEDWKTCKKYSRYGTCQMLVLPQSTEEAASALSVLNKFRVNVVIRGSGASVGHGGEAANEVILSTSNMQEVRVNRSKRTALIHAGVEISKFNSGLREVNLAFPLEAYRGATFGGLIATNAEDRRQMKFGDITNWVKEIKFVSSRGEIFIFKGKEIKQIIGSEGVAGMIAELKIKLKDLERLTYEMKSFESFEMSFREAKEIGELPQTNYLELLNKNVSRLIGLKSKYHLIVEKEQRSKVINKKYNLYTRVAIDEMRRGKYFVDFHPAKNGLKKIVKYLENRKIPFCASLGNFSIFASPKSKRAFESCIKYAKKNGIKIGGAEGYGAKYRKYMPQKKISKLKTLKALYDPENILNTKLISL